MFSDKNEGHRDGEEASVDIFCLLSFSFSLLCAAQEGLMPGGGVEGRGARGGGEGYFALQVGEFGLRNLTTVPYANHPKEEVVLMNRPTEISRAQKAVLL